MGLMQDMQALETLTRLLACAKGILDGLGDCHIGDRSQGERRGADVSYM